MNRLRTSSNDTPAISATGLVKRFGPTVAVDGVDLHIPKGMVYGFLGPNGAGKTTTIRMLATLLQPDSGSAEVFGYDLATDADEVRRRISLTGQFASVDEDMTGLENLRLIARLQGYGWRESRTRSEELLNAFGLDEAATRRVKTYSGGMRRRLDIAASVVVSPELLFLDEPTTGLDPRSRNQVWQIVRTLVRAGTTVLLTTQYLDEADQLADRIAVIDKGKVIAEGQPSDLKAMVGSGVLHIRLANAEARIEAQRLLRSQLENGVHEGSHPASLTVRIKELSLATRLLDELIATGLPIIDFSMGQPSLDEVFLKLTGHLAEPKEESETNPSTVEEGE